MLRPIKLARILEKQDTNFIRATFKRYRNRNTKSVQLENDGSKKDGQYKPVLFNPIKYSSAMSSVCYLPVEEDIETGEISTADPDMFKLYKE